MTGAPAARVAVVTGAARGIGAATVRRLTAEGCRVLAIDSCQGSDTDLPYALATRSDLDALASRVGPELLLTHVADVRDRPALRAGVELALERWGRIDAVVAAAAVIAGGASLWETSDADLDLLWEVDARGVWNTAAATVPTMLENPDPSGCRFVAVSSAAGTHGLYRLAAYNAAKHAVVGMTKGLAADLVGTGVTACVVSPGSTRTAMLEATSAVYALPDTEALGAHQLLRRALEPDEVAATIAYCCSVEAAALNGSIVHADGGFSP